MLGHPGGREPMAGVPIATLDGWAIPMVGTPWDHTYAISSCGLRWRCWGRSAGGRQLGAASGSSLIADCLSQPNSQAGINYYVTGVCHQTANRILHPAQVTVAGCRGYPVSYFMFGAYGRGNWPELTKCYVGAPIIVGSSGAHTSNPQGDDMATKEAYDRTVSKGRTEADDGELTHLRELRALVQLQLHTPLPAATFLSLAAIQEDLRKTQGMLASHLESHAMNSDEYLSRTEAALRDAMVRSLNLLGQERFNALFGDCGNHPEGLVDREVFLESRSRRPFTLSEDMKVSSVGGGIN
jgi:hypothetical protein